MIAEIKFDPQENAQNQIKLFTTDDIQILGNLNTIGKNEILSANVTIIRT